MTIRFVILFLTLLTTVLLTFASQAEVRNAIIDNDFTGFLEETGSTLPENTRYMPGRVQTPVRPTGHGLKMAQVLAEEIGDRIDYELYLFQVTGYTNFKDAITIAIGSGIDVIVHPLVREYGSNFDGRGFYNVEVDRAIEAGIVWLNAAGNFGLTTYTGYPAIIDEGGSVVLPGSENTLPLTCEPPDGIDRCRLRLVLTWTDHKDDVTEGTDKDLDLLLTRENANAENARDGDTFQSSLRQVLENTGEEGTSLYPREIIEADLEPGTYQVHIFNLSRNFTDEDRFRLVTDSEHIQFPFNQTRETILPPADHPDVITVGASDTPRSSQSLLLGKPEVTLSSATDVDGRTAYGSSFATAKAGARTAVFLDENESFSREDLLNAISRGDTGDQAKDQENNEGKEGDCFNVVHLPPQPWYIENILRQGGQFVQTDEGLKIATTFDPIRLHPFQQRMRPDEILFTTPGGLLVRPRRRGVYRAPPNWAEIFQLPKGASFCPSH